MGDNILTMTLKEAEAELRRRRHERTNNLNALASDRKVREFRALLKSGHKDSLFCGFTDKDLNRWTRIAKSQPEEWVWVKAKSGILGVPFPDGSEYCFAPGVIFPLFKEYRGHIHNSMLGEVREI